jgi:hypothetical protein
MRSMAHLAAMAAALLLGASVASADGPYDVNNYWHNPLDLIAYDPPGPQPGTDGTGDQLTAISFPGRALGIAPPRPADPNLVNDPKAVRWPTLDKSEWEKYKDRYTILPSPY